MYCGNCGKTIKGNESFCPYCGEKVIHNEYMLGFWDLLGGKTVSVDTEKEETQPDPEPVSVELMPEVQKITEKKSGLKDKAIMVFLAVILLLTCAGGYFIITQNRVIKELEERINELEQTEDDTDDMGEEEAADEDTTDGMETAPEDSSSEISDTDESGQTEDEETSGEDDEEGVNNESAEPGQTEEEPAADDTVD